jgi:hypothetical protein
MGTSSTRAQRPYTGALPEEFPGFFQRIIPIDREKKTATVASGVVVAIADRE